MATHQPSTRRDQRFALRSGSSSVEYRGGLGRKGAWSGSLNGASAAGVTFCVDAATAPIAVSSQIQGVVVQIGECRIQGDLVILSARSVDAGTEYGGLFYPINTEGEHTWMTLLAGIEAAQPS